MPSMITFGKYRGRTWEEVAERDRSYLTWVASKDGMPLAWKEAATAALAECETGPTCGHPTRPRYPGRFSPWCWPCYSDKVWKGQSPEKDGAWALYRKNPEQFARRAALMAAGKGKRGVVGFTKHRRAFSQPMTGLSGPVTRTYIDGSATSEPEGTC